MLLYELQFICFYCNHAHIHAVSNISTLNIKSNITKHNFFLRIIILTYKRPNALTKCLQSLSEADYVGDRVDVDIWIDRNKENVLDMETYKVASSFRWRHGNVTVHPHPVHVGIYGQWLSTWLPNNRTPAEENAVFVEDDIIVSKSFYIWLKTMHTMYAGRNDVSGFALQGKILVMSGWLSGSLLSVPKHHTVFMYRIFGTWGFSPNRRVWTGFLDWYNQQKTNTSFQPYIPNILPTAWYKSLKASKRGDSMWSIWFLYYTYIKKLYCVYPNFKDGVLVVNKELPGLHYSTDRKISTNGLLQNLRNKSRKYPRDPIRIEYDGSVVAQSP